MEKCFSFPSSVGGRQSRRSSVTVPAHTHRTSLVVAIMWLLCQATRRNVTKMACEWRGARTRAYFIDRDRTEWGWVGVRPTELPLTFASLYTYFFSLWGESCIALLLLVLNYFDMPGHGAPTRNPSHLDGGIIIPVKHTSIR